MSVILARLVEKPASKCNIGPRDMFVARPQNFALLAQANMVLVAIIHETGPQQI